MAQLKDMAESRAALLNFDPRKLKVKPGLNARDLETPDNREHIEWLAQSIANEGVKTPLVIFTDGEDVFLADGHCRLAATMLAISRGAPIETIPCVPERRGTNDVDRILSQNVFNSGKRLTPLEESRNIKRAMDMGALVKDIAAKLGKSETYVANAIDLQAAPAEVHQMIQRGEVSATLAAKTIRREGDKGVETIKKAVETAKAKGKAKATEKHVAIASEAAHNERTNPIEDIKIREKGDDCLSVTLGRTDFVMSKDAWARLARRIIFAVEPPVATTGDEEGTASAAVAGIATAAAPEIAPEQVQA